MLDWAQILSPSVALVELIVRGTLVFLGSCCSSGCSANVRPEAWD